MYNCDETSETKKSSEDGKSSEKSDENSETSKSSETQEKDEDGNSDEKSDETSASEEKKILKSEIEQLKKQLEELTSDETSKPKKSDDDRSSSKDVDKSDELNEGKDYFEEDGSNGARKGVAPPSPKTEDDFLEVAEYEPDDTGRGNILLAGMPRI